MAHELVVNGTAREVDVRGEEPLVHVLRERLGMRGVRVGCAVGDCGSCTVLVDGAPTRSCITPVAEVGDRPVITPEGLGTPERPHPIQRTFLDAQAAQCGYCVNGIIMTVAGLASRGGSRADVRTALDDHICRCGTQTRLLAAAQAAVEAGALPTPHPTEAAPGTDVSSDTPSAPALPDHVITHPRVEQWLRLTPAGRVEVLTGKVEIGQGIRTALAQIVAAQLHVSLAVIDLVPTSTDVSPDQRYTSGSESIQQGGDALGHAAVALRRLALGRAASRTGRSADELQLGAGGVVDGSGSLVCGFAELLEDGLVDGPITHEDRPDWRLPPIGAAVSRTDLLPKLTGAPAYLQDVDLPGMLHARVVLPPTPDAQLLAAPTERVQALPGVVDVHVDGRLMLVLAESSLVAERAATSLLRDLRWEAVALAPPRDLEKAFRAAPAERHVVRDEASPPASAHALERTYVGGYRSHGPVAPSAAIARWDGDHLWVLSHTQGVHPLQRELATLLGLNAADITVEHHDGPGCYGMNGADDAAALAAIAAMVVPDRHVRFQLSMSDEFGWAPLGPAMVVDLRAGLDDARISSWSHHGYSDVHKTRPNGSGTRLFPAWLRSPTAQRPWPGPEEGGARNAVPMYHLPHIDAAVDYVRGPVRTSALRCLGAVVNVFAIESFMDELAETAGQDPVAFRLAHLTDPRGRAVLEAVVDRAGWRPHVGPSGRGLGVAVARYKNSRAWVAMAASVSADHDAGTFRVERLTLACDAGTVVNPDGLRNQLEGGALQGLSRAMYEQVKLGDAGVISRDWTTYGTLRFSDVPTVTVHLVDRPGMPPVGAGEAATPLVAPAVANAIDDAFGVRLRRLPLTQHALERRLLELDQGEMARVVTDH